MYSSLGIIKNPKTSKRLVGTHQKIDKVAYRLLRNNVPKRIYFPTAEEIIYFEGMRGPDGLKRKSPGIDEPSHFVLQDGDDRHLIKIILDHQHNLRQALKKGDTVRASFEAAWMAHAITDGLTPAHHFPLSDATKKLMTDKDFVKVFGEPIKGIMRGDNWAQVARNNWLYWGAKGYMNKHCAFEYGVALATASMSKRQLTPSVKKRDFRNVDLETEFYRSLRQIYSSDIYKRFCKKGWTTSLALEVKRFLLPEIVKVVALGWASAIPSQAPKQLKQGKAKKKVKK